MRPRSFPRPRGAVVTAVSKLGPEDLIRIYLF